MLTRRLAIIPLILLVLASCQDTALLLPELDTSRSNIVNTIAKGAVLGPDQGMPLSLVPQEDLDMVPDMVELTIRNQDGATVDFLTVPVKSVREGSTLPASVPFTKKLSTGKYNVDLMVKKGTEILERRTSSFFYSSTPLVAETITVAPLSLEAGAWGVASLKMQGEEDALVRWTLHGKQLKISSKGSGGDIFVFTTPQQSGTYELLAELFPEVQPSLLGPDDKSSIFVRYSLIVSEEPASSRKTAYFSPRGVYKNLLLLEGSLRDWSFLPNQAPWKAMGSPRYDLYGEHGGYGLGGGQYLESSLVPAMDGLLPLTQSWDFLVDLSRDGLNSGNLELMKVRGSDGKDLLRFGLKNNSVPFLESTLPGLSGYWSGDSPIANITDGPVHLRLAFQKLNTGLHILITARSQLVGEFDFILDTNVRTVIGAKLSGTVLGSGGNTFGLLGFAHADSPMLAEALSLGKTGQNVLAWHRQAPSSSLVLPKLAQGERLRFALGYSYPNYDKDVILPLNAEFLDAAGTVTKVSTVKLVTAEGDNGVLYFDVDLSKNVLRFTIADRVQKVQSVEVPVLVRLSVPEIPKPLVSDGFKIYPVK